MHKPPMLELHTCICCLSMTGLVLEGVADHALTSRLMQAANAFCEECTDHCVLSELFQGQTPGVEVNVLAVMERFSQ